MQNKCVCCGADIPEGRMVCPNCESGGENKGRCKWYKDEVCVNADCPYVADFCPVAQDDSICKFRG